MEDTLLGQVSGGNVVCVLPLQRSTAASMQRRLLARRPCRYSFNAVLAAVAAAAPTSPPFLCCASRLQTTPRPSKSLPALDARLGKLPPPRRDRLRVGGSRSQNVGGSRSQKAKNRARATGARLPGLRRKRHLRHSKLLAKAEEQNGEENCWCLHSVTPPLNVQFSRCRDGIALYLRPSHRAFRTRSSQQQKH